eukprot:401385_1
MSSLLQVIHPVIHVVIICWFVNVMSTETKPNFIVFYIDDISWTTSMSAAAPIGVELNDGIIEYTDVNTPNIQRIIDEGITFTKAYANPKCTPSRFSLLTSRYAVRSQWGIAGTLRQTSGVDGTDVDIQSSKLTGNDNLYNIPNILKTIGNYSTGFVGKWHLMTGNDNGYGYDCRKLQSSQDEVRYNQCRGIVKEAGFDFVDAFYPENIAENGLYSHNPEWMVKCSQRFIDEAMVNQKPFFLYFANTLTHSPSAKDGLLNYGIEQTPKGNLSGTNYPNNTGMDSR